MIDDSQLVQKLVLEDIIDQEALRKGLALREETGDSLYETLIAHHLAPEAALVHIASEMLNVPFVNLDECEFEPETLAMVPGSIAARNRSLPLRLQEEDGTRQLLLAMADPIDVLAMDEIASHTGVDIRPVLVGPEELARALRKAYHIAKSDNSAENLFTDLEEIPEEELVGISDISIDEEILEPEILDEPELLDADDIFLEPDPPKSANSSDRELAIEAPEGVASEDSWAVFFDEAHEPSVEESSVISQDMRDRPPTDVFEVVDEDQLDDGEDDAIDALGGPLEDSQVSGGIHADLGGWELDHAIETGAREKSSPRQAKKDHTDYGKIGELFVKAKHKGAYVPPPPSGKKKAAVPKPSGAHKKRRSSASGKPGKPDKPGKSGVPSPRSLRKKSAPGDLAEADSAPSPVQTPEPPPADSTPSFKVAAADDQEMAAYGNSTQFAFGESYFEEEVEARADNTGATDIEVGHTAAMSGAALVGEIDSSADEERGPDHDLAARALADDDSPGPATLARIKVKRIAVSRSALAIKEKPLRGRDPETREVDDDEMAEIAVAEVPSESSDGLGESTTAAEGDAKKQIERLAGLMRSIDDRRESDDDTHATAAPAEDTIDDEPDDTAADAPDSDLRKTTSNKAIASLRARSLLTRSHSKSASRTSKKKAAPEPEPSAETKLADAPADQLVRAVVKVMLDKGLFTAEELAEALNFEND